MENTGQSEAHDREAVLGMAVQTTHAQGTAGGLITDGAVTDPNAVGLVPVDPAQAAALYGAAAASATTDPTATDAQLGDTGLPSASDLLNPPAESASVDGKQHFWNVPPLFTPPGGSKQLKLYIGNVDQAIQIAVDLLGEGTCVAPPTPADLSLPSDMGYVDSSALSAGYTTVTAQSQATADSLAAAHTQVLQVTGAAADGKEQALIRIQDVVSVLQALLKSVAAMPKLSAADEAQLMKILGEAVTAIYDKIQKVADDNQTMAGTGTTGTTGTGTTVTGDTSGTTDTGSGTTDTTGTTTAASSSSGLGGMLPLLGMLAMPLEQVVQSVAPALLGQDKQHQKPGDPQLVPLQQQHDTVAQTVTATADAPQVVDGSQPVAPAGVTATPATPAAATVAPAAGQTDTQQSDSGTPANSVLL